MVAEVFAGISSLKAALDIAKTLKDIDDVTRRNLAVIELSEKIIAAQATQTDLAEMIGELKSRLAKFETWKAESERHELREISDGTFAYVVKEDMQGVEPKHAICPSCYQKSQKSILQAYVSSFDWGYAKCPSCKEELSFNPDGEKSPFSSLRGKAR